MERNHHVHMFNEICIFGCENAHQNISLPFHCEVRKKFNDQFHKCAAFFVDPPTNIPPCISTVFICTAIMSGLSSNFHTFQAHSIASKSDLYLMFTYLVIKRDSTRAKDTGVFHLSHFSESIVRWSPITDWKTILPCKYTVIFFFTIQIEVKLNYFRSISDCVFFQLPNKILLIEYQTTINVLREKGSITVDIPTRKSLQWKMGARGRDFSI